jgi:flagellar motor switch protein FliG
MGDMGKTNSPGGESLRRGLAAYRKNLGDEGNSGAEAQKKPRLVEHPVELPPEFPPEAQKRDFLSTLIRKKQQKSLSPAALEKISWGKREPEVENHDSRIRRLAKFFILVGSDRAAGILSYLEPDQVEAVSKEIASIRGIRTEEGEEILREFQSLLTSSFGYYGASSGGVDEARRLLYAAYGPEKGEAFLKKALPEEMTNPFNFLEDFSGEQLAMLLKDESPAAAAMVLSRLSSKLSASVLANTAPDQKLEIVRRIAHQKQTSPEVLEQAAKALREKVRHIGHTKTTEIDGPGTLAAILRYSDISFGDKILESLEEEDPELGQNLKDKLYTLEDVILAENLPVQEKLRTMADRDIVLLIKGRSDAFTHKILANLSIGRQDTIREEAKIMGPVPRREIDRAARDFLAWFRSCREEGKIIMSTDEDVV